MDDQRHFIAKMARLQNSLGGVVEWFNQARKRARQL